MIQEYQLAITDRDNQIQAIQYKNVGLQGEIRAKNQVITDLLQIRYVPRRGDIDNVLSLIDKQCDDDVPNRGYPGQVIKVLIPRGSLRRASSSRLILTWQEA